MVTMPMVTFVSIIATPGYKCAEHANVFKKVINIKWSYIYCPKQTKRVFDYSNYIQNFAFCTLKHLNFCNLRKYPGKMVDNLQKIILDYPYVSQALILKQN